ncbi:redox-sensitive transcriptional activator SoxR [Aliivibrio sp. S4TY2]|uniref:redox-sensitive transcriptional activator SoxR n=1 Tax=unclassified Aliivibrio TaxID=2645654 RepID=UPI002378FA69|nr:MULTISPECIES: redox-sensitive transcriptional activator SoxR [unclassified Aliivibrio]MDD9155219.1 redox-sensitive transcriptional activator SoxR [Aliivibrio sp. S4TY2]MDD9159229.1 redox-sensitive transcriptional activator SoxR [Aliivibrio sp. S4TY1]MDD9163221.1 redox-sensitive transcriptional activator SoxR [Aliivibrio sp. S4MY2]MDD9167228.1 redox-sensitive transcriptional activator SoxR [Aliivibrio sp. S4MY4]MDD9184298.1 redox-sensitive transcriptional activator SoxR [Aliivibrio sp. S4MY3
MLNEKTLLTIGMLSERSGVAHSALRFYETKELIASIRTSGNQRRYHPSMLRRIALIQVAQLVGFTLEEITKELEDLPMQKTATKRDWEKVASKWQKDLDAKLHQIQSLKENLTGCIGCGCLSMDKCQLLNPDDILHEEGCGAQRIVME